MAKLKRRSILNVTMICLAIATVVSGLMLANNLVGAPYTAFGETFVVAETLPQKPDAYFALENPESYVLQAITSQNWVKVNSSQVTQITEMKTTHNTSNVEFNGNYYTIQLAFSDGIRPNMQWNITEGILIFSAASLLAICLFKIGEQFVKARNRTQNMSVTQHLEENTG